MDFIIYGIPNCGSVKKAREFFEQHQIAYHFHDFKKSGITEEKLTEWCEIFGWENVLNKKGMTWRNLQEDIKRSATDQTTAVHLMLENMSAIKRPVVQSSQINLIGFDVEKYKQTIL